MEVWQILLQFSAVVIPIAVVLIQCYLGSKKEKEIANEQGRLQRGLEYYKSAIATIDYVAGEISHIGHVYNNLLAVNDEKDFSEMNELISELSRCRGRLAVTVSNETLMAFGNYFELFSSVIKRSDDCANRERDRLNLRIEELDLLFRMREEKMQLQKELFVGKTDQSFSLPKRSDNKS